MAKHRIKTLPIEGRCLWGLFGGERVPGIVDSGEGLRLGSMALGPFPPFPMRGSCGGDTPHRVCMPRVAWLLRRLVRLFGNPKNAHRPLQGRALLPTARGTAAAAAFNFCGQIVRGIGAVVYLETLPDSVRAYQEHGLVVLAAGESPAKHILANGRGRGNHILFLPRWTGYGGDGKALTLPP